MAMRRTAVNAWPVSGSPVAKTSAARSSWQRRLISAISVTARLAGSSGWTTSIAAALSGDEERARAHERLAQRAPPANWVVGTVRG
jgi:Na+(H+)/acetate symporter ActP